MRDSNQDRVQAAEGYEELLVPGLFEQWVDHILDAAKVGPGHRVLDVACGTGVLARRAAARVGRSGAVVGIDPDPGMLAIAGRLGPALEWRRGSAESLPFPDESLDVVVSQFGLMFFADRERALREMMRVLVPGGRGVIAVWDSLENNSAYATEVSILDRIAGSRAGDAVRMPFALGDRNGLATLFGAAGMASTEIVTRAGKGRFPSVGSMVEADLKGWLPMMGVMLDESQSRRILAEADRDLARFVTAEGQVVFDVSAHIVAVSKPEAKSSAMSWISGSPTERR